MQGQQVGEEDEGEPTEEQLMTFLCATSQAMLAIRGTSLNRGRTSTWRALIYQHLLTMKETIEDLEKFYC